MQVRYPHNFEVSRLEPIGDPPFLAPQEAQAAYNSGRLLMVIPDELSPAGKPAWLVMSSGTKCDVTYYSPQGSPIRKATWVRDDGALRCAQVQDFVYPDGDPAGPMARIDIPYVDREISATGVMTVTYAPPGRVSGQRARTKKRKGKTPAWADHDQTDARNGPMHIVRGVAVVRVPVPPFDAWDALITATLPDDPNRFGPDALAAALELAGRDTPSKEIPS